MQVAHISPHLLHTPSPRRTAARTRWDGASSSTRCVSSLPPPPSPRRPAAFPPQSAIFDFPSLLIVILLMICSCAYIRAATLRRDPASGTESSMLDSHKHGVRGVGWKFARIGERVSPWIAASCIAMAVHLLFIK